MTTSKTEHLKRRVDAYFEPCLNLYDIAAGVLISLFG